MSSSDQSTRSEILGQLGEISWMATLALTSHVMTEADRKGATVVVALVDRWGRKLAFHRQPGAVMASSAVALAKALTACTFNVPTALLLETISRHDQLELGRANPGLVFAGGGFPLRVAGLQVGGIGVSGSSSEEDAELALNALRHVGFDATFAELTPREPG